MKIGILTFHRAENFGATLQVYALQSFLKKLGHNAIIVDYRCKNIELQYDILHPRIFLTQPNIYSSLYIYISRLKNYKERIIKKKKYHQFWSSMLQVSKQINKISKLNEYDAIIVGSDQVWNTGLAGGFDKFYFLDYDFNGSTRKISFSASSEITYYKDLTENRNIIKCINSFDAISVREQSLKEKLQPFLNKDISVTLDPTFLLPKESFLQIAQKPKIDNYILVYHLYPTKLGVTLAEKIAKEKGLKIVEIHAGFGKYPNNNRHIQTAGPAELLGYIAYADIVIATSFHGLALSLILNKEIWMINIGSNYRIKSLLSLCNLNHRLINDINDYNNQKINYQEVNAIIDKEISKSKQFLYDNL